MAQVIDPITFEIIKHKFFRVTEEAAIALENVSGSPATSEAHDMVVALFAANGDLHTVGGGFLQHLTSASLSVKHILQRFSSNEPWIFEDDVFMFNDSYSGALHCPDSYMISPIHWKGKLAGFVMNFVHLTDVGGIDPGGFCPNAKNVYQEGFRTKGLKLVERGKIRSDVFETILNLVRDPGMVGLDLKSQIAANNVAKERMHKLYQDYGFEIVDAVGRQLIDQSEQLMRQRLRELPDGVFRARQYFDLPDRILRVELTATKEADSLTYDFTGTSEQAPYGINSCYAACWGACFGSIFPALAWDITWNEGITRPVKLIAPEGSVVNCKYPAPVSIATIGICQNITSLSLLIISKMLGATEKYKNRATAIWSGSHIVNIAFGLDSKGEFRLEMSSDSFAGAGGARAFMDGIDNGGEVPSLVSRMANVETHELNFPQLYLYRRVVPDSGGPGKYRGGNCHEWAIIPHGSPTNSFESTLMSGKGFMSPMSVGIFGGYPGCNTDYTQFRGSNASEFPSSSQFTMGKREDHVRLGVVELKGDDIMFNHLSGGGGYGDPLDRELELVLKDVLLGLVTNGPARDIYGVVIDFENKRVDIEATYKQRLALRKDRLAGRKPGVDVSKRANVPLTGMQLGEYLQVTDSGKETFVQCTWCGRKICPADSNWKDNVVTRKVSVIKSGPRRKEGEFFMREFFCPSCATLLDLDVVHKDDPPLYDKIYGWPKQAKVKE